MKKLFLLMAMAVLSLCISSCGTKHEMAGNVNFVVRTNCNTAADSVKIVDVLKSKGLPIGVTHVSVEGDTQEELEVRVQQILADLLIKVKQEEIKALNTGATFVIYSGTFVGASRPVASYTMNL